MDGLGENMLIEISSRFCKEVDFETIFDKESLFCLMQTANEHSTFDKNKIQ